MQKKRRKALEYACQRVAKLKFIAQGIQIGNAVCISAGLFGTQFERPNFRTVQNREVGSEVQVRNFHLKIGADVRCSEPHYENVEPPNRVVSINITHHKVLDLSPDNILP